MRNLSDQFDHIFRASGGRLGRSSLDVGLRPFIDQYLSIFRSAGASFDRRNVYVDFIDNGGFNAIASGQYPDEFIGIYFGTILRLQVYFNALMSDPEVFPDVDINSEESVNEETISLIRSGTSALDLKSNLSPVQLSKPKSPHRQTLANHMNLIACLMLLFHEFAHLTRGHLLYLQDECGMAELSELPIVPISERESRLRRVLEVDADRCSVMTGLKYLPLVGNLVPELKEADELRIWGACTFMVYSVMDQLSASNAGDKHSTHPSVWARASAIDYALGVSDAIPKDTEDGIGDGLDVVFDWWERHKLPSTIRSAMYSAIQEQEELDIEYFGTLVRIEQYMEERLGRIKRDVK